MLDTAKNDQQSAKTVMNIQSEMNLHIEYCSEFGLSKEEIEATPESQACTAYTR